MDQLSALFTSRDLLLKKGGFRFLKDKTLIEISTKMCKRGLFWALCIASILKLSLLTIFWLKEACRDYQW